MATAAIKRKRKQKPQSAKRQTPQDKHQRNHPMAQGKKTKTPGGQKPQSSKRQPSTTTTERKTPQHAEAPGHQKTNANSSDQQTDSNHNQRQTPTAVDKNLKARNAKTTRGKPKAIKCSAEHGGWIWNGLILRYCNQLCATGQHSDNQETAKWIIGFDRFKNIISMWISVTSNKFEYTTRGYQWGSQKAYQSKSTILPIYKTIP